MILVKWCYSAGKSVFGVAPAIIVQWDAVPDLPLWRPMGTIDVEALAAHVT